MKYFVLALLLIAGLQSGGLAQGRLSSKVLKVEERDERMVAGKTYRVVDGEAGVICYVAQGDMEGSPHRAGTGVALQCFRFKDLEMIK